MPRATDILPVVVAIPRPTPGATARPTRSPRTTPALHNSSTTSAPGSPTNPPCHLSAHQALLPSLPSTHRAVNWVCECCCEKPCEWHRVFTRGNRGISPPVSVAASVAVSVAVRSPVSRSVHNRAMIRLRSTHSDRLTSVSSRTTRHRTTPSRVPTAGVETTDEAWVLLPEAPNPRPTGDL